MKILLCRRDRLCILQTRPDVCNCLSLSLFPAGFRAINSRRSCFFVKISFFLSFCYPAISDADVSSTLERSQIRDPGSQA